MPSGTSPLRVLLAMAFIACTPTSIESARWWHSPRFVTALSLTRTQQAAIERIYQDTLVERMSRAAKANASRDALNRLMDAGAPEADVEAAAAAAADDDAARRRTRALMLFRMLRVLTQDQRQRLGSLVPRRALEP